MAHRPLHHSFRDASAGVIFVLKRERNFRIHAIVALLVVALGFWLNLERTEWAVLLLTISAVFAAEVLNTVAEAIVDLLSPEYRDSAKIAKDAAAGCVLLLAAGSVAIGLLILGPPLWAKLFAK